MKIAIISDIHANLPALEAALKSVEAHQPDAIYCLGDLVGYNVWPNEVINEIRRRNIPTLAGNHDTKVKKLTPEQLAESGKNYAYAIIGQDEKAYLASLPPHIRVTFQYKGQPFDLLMVHGSPTSNEEYLLEDKDSAEFIEVLQQTGADILCFGHSHKPYHRILQTSEGKTLHAINAGSIGKPKDGDARACYVLLNVDQGSVKAKFIRVAYDIEKASSAIEESPLPNEFADMLKRAY